MANPNRSAAPFDREPIERGYHIAALAAAIHKITDADSFGSAEADIRHLAVAIEDEACALIDELEKAAQASREAGLTPGPLAAADGTGTGTGTGN